MERKLKNNGIRIKRNGFLVEKALTIEYCENQKEIRRDQLNKYEEWRNL